jgi:hypothetical protein
MDKPDDIKKELKRIFNLPFTKADIHVREQTLNNSRFSNKHNIDQLIGMLF